MPEDESNFFEKERDRLALEIASGFEHLLTVSNLLNRKVEEVLGMTKEYDTIASLWARFHALMRAQGGVDDVGSGIPGTEGTSDESLVVSLHDRTSIGNAPSGLPGTGGHTLHMSSAKDDGSS